MYSIALYSRCSCYCVHLLSKYMSVQLNIQQVRKINHLFFSSRELGFIDVSLKLLSFFQTAHLESRDGIFERKSKIR